MIFLDFFQTIKAKLNVEKQNQLFAKMKKGSGHQDFCKLNREERIEKNDGIVVDSKITDDGTIRLYLNDEAYPVRIYPDGPTVLIISAIKRFIPLVLANIRKQGLLSKIITLLSIRINYNLIIEWLDNIFYLYDLLLKEEHWSQPIKEVRRVLKGRVDNRIIDGISLILEFDSAYRFIFQDIVSLLDKTEFEMKPAQEIKRLMNIAIGRAGEGDKPKFENIYSVLSVYLFFNRKFLKQLKEIVKDLNIDEVKPNEEDTYWMYFLRTYNCFGLPVEQRMARYNMIKNGGSVETLLNKSVAK